MAEREASKSRCRSRSVGACLVTEDGMRSVGHNRPPKGIPDCANVGCRDERDGKCSNCLHAEIVAINAAIYSVRLPPSTLYITCPPCLPCALSIAEAGVKRVVFYDYRKTDEVAIERLCEAGCEVVIVCR